MLLHHLHPRSAFLNGAFHLGWIASIALLCTVLGCSRSDTGSGTAPAGAASAKPASSPDAIRAATPGGSAANAGAASSAASSTAVTPGGGPCALLTGEEIRQAFPDFDPAKADRRSGGARSCEWSHRGGRLSLVVTPNSSRPINADAGIWAREWLDPFQRDAVRNLRLEVMRGIGDEAVAIVEPSAPERGIVDDGAMVIVRRGPRQVLVMAPGLARRDRSEALRTLERLAAALAARLE